LAKDALQIEMNHQKKLNEAVGKNFGDQLRDVKADKDKYMNKVLGYSGPSQVDRNYARIHLDESLDQTPNIRNEGQPVNRGSGSAIMT
jgi:hypothetical protein